MTKPWTYPKDSGAWAHKGLSLGKLGRHEEAIQCYDKALELDPKASWAWSNKGWSLGELGRHEEAIQCCDKALELDPKDSVAWINKGRSLGELGRHEEAIHVMTKPWNLTLKLVGLGTIKVGASENEVTRRSHPML